jgi:hypothetical protein
MTRLEMKELMILSRLSAEENKRSDTSRILKRRLHNLKDAIAVESMLKRRKRA